MFCFDHVSRLYVSINSSVCVFSDGNFLAVGSHDNFIYIYNVTDNGRRYSRFGKCNVGPKSRVQGQKEQRLMWSWSPDFTSGKRANDNLVAHRGLCNFSEGVDEKLDEILIFYIL